MRRYDMVALSGRHVTPWNGNVMVNADDGSIAAYSFIESVDRTQQLSYFSVKS